MFGLRISARFTRKSQKPMLKFQNEAISRPLFFWPLEFWTFGICALTRCASPLAFTGCPIGFARRLVAGMGLLCVTAAQLWPVFTAFPVSSEFGDKERQTIRRDPDPLTIMQALFAYRFTS